MYINYSIVNRFYSSQNYILFEDSKQILISSVTDIYCSLIDDKYFIDKKNTLIDFFSLASSKSTVDERYL